MVSPCHERLCLERVSHYKHTIYKRKSVVYMDILFKIRDLSETVMTTNFE